MTSDTNSVELNINFGGYKNRPDLTSWTVMDINANNGIENNGKLTVEGGIYYDFSDGKFFPIPDNFVNSYYSSMTIEHMTYRYAAFVLDEMFRTIKPGKKIRIVVPDFDIALKTYSDTGIIPDHFPSGGDPEYPITRLFAFVCTPDVYRSYGVDDRGEYWDNYEFHGTPLVKQGIGDRVGLSFFKSGHKAAWNFDLMKKFLADSGFINIEKKSFGEFSEIFKDLDNKHHKDYGLYVEAEKPTELKK